MENAPSKHMDFYSELGLQRFCSFDEIDRQYKLLALKRHPDKSQGNHDDFCRLNHVYTFLKTKRELYDFLMYSHDLIIFDEISINDMFPLNKLLCYDCRCGGLFQLQDLDVNVKLDKINCTHCSLCIKIIYD